MEEVTKGKDGMNGSNNKYSGGSAHVRNTIFENVVAGDAKAAAVTTLDVKEKKIPKQKSGSKISAKDIMKNPALAKLLVLAARKMKEKEAEEQQKQRISST